ncbi:hypothetical protein G6O69_29730 [Pseudenhygromyxa sp. WMMC2535]|uniref:hypothetical protein n=1 Tax=Pseudenhygromyxa sp. WMMC2535 TaxID=2712867 RepID=UPI001594EB3F|nr:hypothetical protein [Pseudenhygromyxa sp. WMMC2535]NVB42043.1 hypothetical protein [Pseudenhygromyxa sp. WMMC2535]
MDRPWSGAGPARAGSSMATAAPCSAKRRSTPGSADRRAAGEVELGLLAQELADRVVATRAASPWLACVPTRIGVPADPAPAPPPPHSSCE